MTRAADRYFATLLIVSVGTTALAASPPPAITGEVRALNAQPIYTPPTMGGPVVLRYFIADGAEVSPGEPLLRIDPGNSASRLRQLIAETAKAEATAAKEVAELDVKAVDAELALVDAEAAFEKARIDAALPRELISALDYDRYKGEFERAEREFRLKQRELDAAREAVDRRRRDAKLELQRMRLEQQYHQTQVDAAEVRADRAGVVLHAMDPRTGERFDEGSTSWSGLLAGEVVTFGNMAVRAYVLETDRHYFDVGANVAVEFDAVPGVSTAGKIDSISGAPESRAIWGDGRYFTIEISLSAAAQRLKLLPGMSTRVRPATKHVSSQSAVPKDSAADAILQLEGEIIATRTAPLAPPSLDDVWQLNIAELASEGTTVKTGDVVVRFEVGDLTKRLLENQNALNERLSERGQLVLALAERERDEVLTTAEARAELDKALRKVEQPEDAIRRVDYQKLIVDRARWERRIGLAERRERLAAIQREAERRLLESQIEHLQSEVARLNANIASLSVKAPLTGMMLHRSNFQGEKFAVGSQVWKGISVAEIPDANTLAVRAGLPEREMRRVEVGNIARIRVEGGASSTLSARVVKIGRSVRSKSRVQPIPVVDLLLEFERRPAALRPGQQVRVELDTGEANHE
jgi:multidrug resistance efflux pump